MPAEKNLSLLLKNMTPELQTGAYIFTSVQSTEGIDKQAVICEFKEQEGITLILTQAEADRLSIKYDFVAAWITLKIHSALDAVGLTAAFSTALGAADISCNVIAGYYHDHIFVGYEDREKAMEVLGNFASSS